MQNYKPPCKDCSKRHRACHDTCEEYKAYKNCLEEIRQKERLEWQDRNDEKN